MDVDSDILYKSKNGDITTDDIKKALLLAEIKSGDTLFIHSDVSTIGRPVFQNRNVFLEKIVNVFKEVVGSNGTLIMPTFTYSFCKGEKYDVNNTSSTVGILTEYFRKHAGVMRTKDPIFSTAIWGREAEKISRVGKSCFGEDSIFGYIHEVNAKIVQLGTPQFALTQLHFIEQKLGVSYRFMKKFTGIIKDCDEEYVDEFFYFVRKLDERSAPNVNNLHEYLRNQNLITIIPIGHHYVEVLKENEIFNVLCKILVDDPYSIIG